MKNAERAVKTAAVKTAVRTAGKSKRQLENEQKKKALVRWQREDRKIAVFTDLFMDWAWDCMQSGDKRALKVSLTESFFGILLKILIRGNAVIYEKHGESEDDFMPPCFEQVRDALLNSIIDLDGGVHNEKSA